jgi:hypothetical protein
VVGKIDGEGSAQMPRCHWHDNGTSVHEGSSPEEMGQGFAEQAIIIEMKQLH